MTIENYGLTGSYNSMPSEAMNNDLSMIEDRIRQLAVQSRSPTLHNRRVVLTPRPDIGRVVIKIVEKNTDKVIKELPPVALQHVYRHIRSLLE